MADLDAIHTSNRFSTHNLSSESIAGDSFKIELEKHVQITDKNCCFFGRMSGPFAVRITDGSFAF